MAKIVMPKNSALLEEVEAVLKIYYDFGDWLQNDEYKQQLMALIGDGQYNSSYTKKAQITSYFGFTEWEDINNERSLRRITPSGKSFYKNIITKNEEGIFEDLMVSLEKTTFGRNNFGCPESDSDVEPPILFVRAIVDLGYLTYKEFAFLLWKLEDIGGNYTDAILELKNIRNSNSFVLTEAANKYTDAKPIMVLIRWGFLAEDDTLNGSKRIIINPKVFDKYKRRIQNLKIYNIDKEVNNDNKYELNNNKRNMEVELMVQYETIDFDYNVDELGNLLADMYRTASNKPASIHMFGLKYGELITKNDYSIASIIAKADIPSSYKEEVRKGIKIYEAIKNNEYGIKFYHPEKEDEHTQTKCINLPKLPLRTRFKHSLNSILFGAPGTGKTYSTAQYALAISEDRNFEDLSTEHRADIMNRYNDLIKEGRIVFTTFHQNYGYEDFIQGIRPNTSSKEMSFKTVDGVFKTIADRAMLHPENDYVIIVDEINRANISKVFGELITLIEPDKRWGEINAIKATLPSGDIFAVPNNLYILGTMNSADKSISLIDTALRRRFDFVEYEPIDELVLDSDLRNILIKLNKGISDEFGSTDLLIGHSYFMGKTIDDLCDIMNRNIIPLLYEYFFDNQKKVESQIKTVVEGYSVEVKLGTVGRIKLVKRVLDNAGKKL